MLNFFMTMGSGSSPDPNIYYRTVFSPLFHENTPISSIIQEMGAFGKFFDKLNRPANRRVCWVLLQLSLPG